MDLYQLRYELNNGRSIYNIPMRVTYYARVSTEKDEQANSLRNQIDYYSDFIKRNPNWTYVDGYIDEGLSGTSVNKRESFLRMIEDAKLSKFDFIITKEISRFSRNTMDSIKYTQELLIKGIGVLFQSDNINTLMPDSELRLTIMSSIAQDEVRKISERVKFGFKRAIESGVVLGNSRIWGYDKKDGSLVINKEQAEIVHLIFDLYANHNMGMRAVATELTKKGYRNSNGNEFSCSTIKGIITNPKYKGYYCGNKSHKYDYRSMERKIFHPTQWITYRDEENVPQIISEELWAKANRILANRGERAVVGGKASYTNKYPYSGKIICTEHNASYQRALYRYKSGSKEIWQCKHYAEKGKAGCEMPIIYTSELNEILKDCYTNLLNNKADIICELVRLYSSLSENSTIKEYIAKGKKEINDILKRKDKLLDLSVNCKISDDEFENRNNAFNKEIESFKIKIEEYTAQLQTKEDAKVTLEIIRQIISNELDFDETFDNAILNTLLEKIEVLKTTDKNEINIKIYFKVIDEKPSYTIKRERRNASVWYRQYI